MPLPRAWLVPLLILVSAASATAQADVAGNWRVEFVVPTGERSVTMTINQKGSALTGYIVSEDGQFPVQGRIVDDQISVEWSVPEQGEQMKIVMRGTVKGDDIDGTARVGNVGEGSLFAHRMSRNP